MGITSNIPSSRLAQAGVIPNAAARPASPYAGQMVFQLDTKQLLIWDGAAWVMAVDTDTPPGLELVKTQTVGTGVSSVTVTGAFSADYDNYRIIYSGGTQSASVDFYMQIGGSATGYYNAMTYNNTGTPTPTGVGVTNGTRWDWIGGGTAGQASHASVELLGPFLTQYTKMRNGAYANDNFFGISNGEHRSLVSMTSFLIGVLSGTMSGGTIRVYGYRNQK